jgi:hypothetical protein
VYPHEIIFIFPQDKLKIADILKRYCRIPTYLIVTGVMSNIVVTLSRNADTIAAKKHRIVIKTQIFPFANLYA